MKSKDTLQELYEKHAGKVSDKWAIYLTEYERILAENRDRKIRLLEIGVQNGGSLEIWAKYFPKAGKLVGCDINPDCAQLDYDDPRIGLVVGDANSDEAQKEILRHAPAFDIIIDDGSHRSSDIIKSFARYFPFLADGGVFIVEDLHCSYWQEFEGGLFDPFSAITFFKSLADVINHEHWGISRARADILGGFFEKYKFTLDEDVLGHIHSVGFVNSMCIIRRAQPDSNRLGSRIIAGKIEKVVPGHLELKEQHLIHAPFPDQTHNEWTTRRMSLEEELSLRIKQVAELSAQISTPNRAFMALQNSTNWGANKVWLIIRHQIKKIRRGLIILGLLLSNPNELSRIIIDLFCLYRSKEGLTRMKDHLKREIETYRKLARGTLHVEINQPRYGLASISSEYIVTGWGVDLEAQSAAKVRVIVGRTIYDPQPRQRKDVQQAFGSVCELPLITGFEVVLRLPPGLHRMRIELQGHNRSAIVVKRALLFHKGLQTHSRPIKQRESYYDRIADIHTLHSSIDAFQTSVCRIPEIDGSASTIAVGYLVRGRDEDWRPSCGRFLDSYKKYRSGAEHSLYIIFKGFHDADAQADARNLFADVKYEPVFLDDNAFDIGAYREWANNIDQESICVFNTTSEILTHDWLQKLAGNLALPNVGLVGATGSYESLNDFNKAFPTFPNVHIRSNAFMINRNLFCHISHQFSIVEKIDTLLFESGRQSMTGRVLELGRDILIVGRNGWGYPPRKWSASSTFRQGVQDNLLVADNQTRDFSARRWEEKREIVLRTWGYDINEELGRIIRNMDNSAQ